MKLRDVGRDIVEANKRRMSKYNKFKMAVLQYFGVNSPDELDPIRRKKFYRYIDSEWKRYKLKSYKQQGVQQ